MAAKVHFGMIDHSAEACGPSLWFDDTGKPNYTDVGTAAGLVQTALAILTDCNLTNTVLSAVLDSTSPAVPATVTAQREIAIRIVYRDTVTGKAERFDVPGPATTFYPGSGTDVIPLDNAVAAAFIAVFEAQCVSMLGNPVEVTNIYLVGRNN